MTEQQLRQKVTDIINSWIGATKGSAKHLELLNIYNNYRPLARGYAVQVNDEYCATTVSAAWIKAGIAAYTGTECGVEEFIRIAQDKGIWVENDAYIPKLGDAIVYDWDDSGAGDNRGAGDHIGIVTQPGTSSFVVTEGNMSGGKVGTRTMQIDGRYIRGFIVPKYADIAKAIGGETIQTDTSPDTTSKSIEEIAKEVIAGKWGNGSERRARLQAAGYAYTTVQNKVNELLGVDSKAAAAQEYATGKTNEETIYNFLKTVMGLNIAGACGVLANIQAESSFNPTALGDAGTSYGICQWHASRFTNLKNWCSANGKDYKTIDGQLWYLKYELEQSYSSVLQYIRGVANTAAGAYDAGYRWCLKFEIPADTEASSQKRGNIARDTFWPKYSGNPAPASNTTGETVYTVVKGDTLSKIAGMYGTTYQKLAEYNGIANPDVINVGQKIRIPGTGSGASQKTAGTTTAAKKTDEKVMYAEKFDRSIAGTYVVTSAAGLNVRYGPSTGYGIIKAVSKGTKVNNYGYYSIRGGAKWYYVRIGATVGFVHSDYLAKA